MNTGSRGAITKLPPSRLRRAGPPGASPIDWANRGALLVLAAAVVWFAYVIARPMPAPLAADVSVDAVPTIPGPRAPDESTDRRRGLLAQLSSANLFDAQREAWSSQGQPRAETEQAEPRRPGHHPGKERAPGGKGQPASASGSPAAIVRGDALPDDVKQAVAGLALRAVFADAKGKPVAMISRVFASQNPFVADAFVAGDEFEDKQFPQAKWKVEAVELAARRVILSRGGVTTAIELYPSVSIPKPAATEPAAAAPTAAVVPEVISRSPNEARADLISGGMSAADADRLLELVKLPQEDAATQARLDELAASSAAAEAGKPTKRKGPPPGMEGIIKLMREAANPAEEKPPETPPAEDKADSPKPQ